MSVSEPTRRAYDPALSDVLGDSGHPLSVDHAGRKYTFGFASQLAKDRLEKLAFEAERAVVHAQKRNGILTPEEYELRCDKLAKQAEERQFATGGLLWLKHACGGDGMVSWVQSLLMQHHPAVTRAEVVKLMEDQAQDVKLVLAVIVPPFFVWALGLAAPLVERLAAAGEPKAVEAKAKMDELRRNSPELLGHSTPT